MKNNHNKWRLNRIAGALAVALLPLCEDVLARDVLTRPCWKWTALIRASGIYPLTSRLADSCRGPIG
jgi:hypothetical protein